MADDFFIQLDMFPDFSLNIPHKSPNSQIGEIIIRLENVVNEFNPSLIIVPGDVNSTLAAAITANKMGVPLGHLESGLRSFDRSMPEEINRLLVDEITDYYFVTEQSGVDNLISEGKERNKIYFVRNTMIDTLVAFEDQIQGQHIMEDYNLTKNDFLLMTMHRPATVDNEKGLLQLYSLLKQLETTNRIVFPMHPRTVNNIRKFGLQDRYEGLKNLIRIGPLDYFSFQNLIHNCKIVITDSGGIQEETTFKQKPCLTLRPNTERPITVSLGSNTLLDFEIDTILQHVDAIQSSDYKKGEIPKFWDGNATERILEVLAK